MRHSLDFPISRLRSATKFAVLGFLLCVRATMSPFLSGFVSYSLFHMNYQKILDSNYSVQLSTFSTVERQVLSAER